MDSFLFFSYLSNMNCYCGDINEDSHILSKNSSLLNMRSELFIRKVCRSNSFAVRNTSLSSTKTLLHYGDVETIHFTIIPPLFSYAQVIFYYYYLFHDYLQHRIKQDNFITSYPDFYITSYIVVIWNRRWIVDKKRPSHVFSATAPSLNFILKRSSYC